MNLNGKFPPKATPKLPFIGLFGNHQSNWREYATDILKTQGIDEESIYDSTDLGWSVVNDDNGDELQEWINELVARQHRVMRAATCLIFSLDAHERCWPSKYSQRKILNQPSDEHCGKLYAARCELGWLAGIEKPAFVWVSDDLSGRNYLRAVIRMYENLRECDCLEDAAIKAAKYLSLQAGD